MESLLYKGSLAFASKFLRAGVMYFAKPSLKYDTRCFSAATYAEKMEKRDCKLSQEKLRGEALIVFPPIRSIRLQGRNFWRGFRGPLPRPLDNPLVDKIKHERIISLFVIGVLHSDDVYLWQRSIAGYGGH